jgi:hypothetical protein
LRIHNWYFITLQQWKDIPRQRINDSHKTEVKRWQSDGGRFRQSFLNPQFGRNAKSVLELSRKSIAKRLNASAQEIILRLVERKPTTGYFHSVADLKVKGLLPVKWASRRLYSSGVAKEFGIQVDYVAVKPNGEIDEFSGTARGESKHWWAWCMSIMKLNCVRPR